jgi:hypothetical protein
MQLIDAFRFAKAAFGDAAFAERRATIKTHSLGAKGWTPARDRGKIY